MLFEAAYEILGARRGTAWMANLPNHLPELAMALSSPQNSSLAWHPTSAFVSVLKSLGKDANESREIATQLGRSTVDASFVQFYGADPSASNPMHVLRTTDVFWRCYHSWGAPSVRTNEREAEVQVSNGLASSFLCASTAGLLAGVVARSGGKSVAVEHVACLSEGAESCVFRLKWT